MAVTVYFHPISLIVQYLTNLGLLAQGGQVFTYLGGSVNTPQTTYTDSTGLVPNANPLTLSAAARPVANSGAPVSFWTLGGVLVKLVVVDAQGNLLVALDNIPAINDLTNSTVALQSLLANPASSNTAGSGPVAGVDLVANAMKSYDVFADVRAANVPTLVTGQTLTISTQGAAAVNDGLGGGFYWSASSSAADNGTTVLKPNTSSGNGRWLRLYAPSFGAQATIASAATCDLGTLGTNFVSITGVTGITSFGSSASTTHPLWRVVFTNALTLTYNAASLILPGATNLLTQPNDTALLFYLGSGNWQVIEYTRGSDGGGAKPLVIVAKNDQQVSATTTLANDTELVTPQLIVGATYLLQLRIQWLGSGGTTQGWVGVATFGGTLDGVSSGSALRGQNGPVTSVFAAINNNNNGTAISTGAADMLSADIVFKVLTAGALQFQFTQNSSNVNATIRKANSALILTRLA